MNALNNSLLTPICLTFSCVSHHRSQMCVLFIALFRRPLMSEIYGRLQWKTHGDSQYAT